jgi:hypothetical protein
MVILKKAVFWVIAPCRLVWIYRCFRGLYCLHHPSDYHPDDGGSTDLWNVGNGKLIPVYMPQWPRRQPSTQSLLWELQVINGYIYNTLKQSDNCPSSPLVPTQQIQALRLLLYVTWKCHDIFVPWVWKTHINTCLTAAMILLDTTFFKPYY